jgi:hypothetical protein
LAGFIISITFDLEKVVANIKKVMSKKPKSTIGVMSMFGVFELEGKLAMCNGILNVN